MKAPLEMFCKCFKLTHATFCILKHSLSRMLQTAQNQIIQQHATWILQMF